MGETNTESYHTLVQIPCSVRKAVNFQKSNMMPVGVITSWEFTNSKLKLDTDFPVSNPSSPDSKIKACAVIEYVKWEGHPADPVEFELRVTSPNRGILKQALSAQDGGTELAVQWQVYEYDTQKENHYISFQAESPISFVITKGTKFEIGTNVNTDVDQPPNYTVRMTVMGESKGKDQQVALAASTDVKYNRPIGTNATA